MLVVCLLFVTSAAKSVTLPTVTLNFESGNKAVEISNCWTFSDVDYVNGSKMTGVWSGITNNVQSQEQANSNNWIKSPWIKPQAGIITFNAMLNGNLNNGARGIAVYYIPYDVKKDAEGTPVLISSSSVSIVSPKSQAISVSVPAGIVDGVYKIQIKFFGKSGSAEICVDDISIPGTYYSDPSNNCMPPKPILDADKDGVPDAQDEYPNDPYRAFNNYVPTVGGFGTLSFEDSWPVKGDYDLNDMVIDYNINRITNASNEVVEIKAKFVLRASGATFGNGFGFQLDGITPDKIASAIGYRRSEGSYIKDAANGLEQGQDYATCIVFDNFFNEMKNPGVGLGVNTDESAPFVPYQTVDVTLTLLNNGQAPAGGKVKLADLTPDIFNFFIIANKKRGVEIHLPDRVPTTFADRSLFNTGDDASVAPHYYRTANNLPWALNIIQAFDYPVEQTVVNEGYLHFIDWAASSGKLYPDWYDNKEGYRKPEKIYKKK